MEGKGRCMALHSVRYDIATLRLFVVGRKKDFFYVWHLPVSPGQQAWREKILFDQPSKEIKKEPVEVKQEPTDTNNNP